MRPHSASSPLSPPPVLKPGLAHLAHCSGLSIALPEIPPLIPPTSTPRAPSYAQVNPRSSRDSHSRAPLLVLAFKAPHLMTGTYLPISCTLLDASCPHHMR